MKGKVPGAMCVETLVSSQVECVGPCSYVCREEESVIEKITSTKTVFEAIIAYVCIYI